MILSFGFKEKTFVDYNIHRKKDMMNYWHDLRNNYLYYYYSDI
jgi:hypothetical protein